MSNYQGLNALPLSSLFALKLLQKRLVKAEIIQISMATKSISSENPLMKFAGIFKDDTDFEDIMSDLKAERANESEV